MTFAHIRRAAAVAAACGAALAASPAGATTSEPTLSRGWDNALTYTGASADEHLIVSRGGGGALVVLVSSQVTVTAGPGCVRIEADTRRNKFECGNQTPVTKLAVDMAGGNDRIEWRVPVSGAVHGGDGTDIFVPAPGFHLSGAPSQVVMFGDIGSDGVDYSLSDAGVVVSLDGAANDGRPGDKDSVRPDIENLTGSPFADKFFGTADREVFTPAGGADQVTTNGGVDGVHIADGVADAVNCEKSKAIVATTDPVDVLKACRLTV